jgi:hypothetical protein
MPGHCHKTAAAAVVDEKDLMAMHPSHFVVKLEVVPFPEQKKSRAKPAAVATTSSQLSVHKSSGGGGYDFDDTDEEDQDAEETDLENTIPPLTAHEMYMRDVINRKEELQLGPQA